MRVYAYACSCMCISFFTSCNQTDRFGCCMCFFQYKRKVFSQKNNANELPYAVKRTIVLVTPANTFSAITKAHTYKPECCNYFGCDCVVLTFFVCINIVYTQRAILVYLATSLNSVLLFFFSFLRFNVLIRQFHIFTCGVQCKGMQECFMASGIVFVYICFSFTLPTFVCVLNALHRKRLNDRTLGVRECVCMYVCVCVCAYKHSLYLYLKMQDILLCYSVVAIASCYS